MCKEKHCYPCNIWLKQSIVFATAATTLLGLASITSGDFRTGLLAQLTLSFFIVLSISLINILLHVSFQVEDPIKSPFYVKFISFSVTLAIIVAFHFLGKALHIQDPHYKEMSQGFWNNLFMMSIQAILLNTIVLLWLYFIMSEHAKVQNQLERSRLEKAHEKALNLMLRQQIQPHFLFNALTTLKSLIRKDPNLAETYLVQLSSFLRQSIASVKDGELANIAQEIRVCKDYISMQQMRFGEALHFTIAIPQELYQQSLPIFSLQPLVDNALKHNNFTIDRPLKIEIEEDQGWIVVKNNKNSKNTPVESNGSGLKNLQDRYKNLIKQSIEIEETERYFRVKIKIVDVHESAYN